MREFIAVLYIVGGVITAAGLVIAYRRAHRDLRRLEAVDKVRKSHLKIDLVEEYEAALGEDGGQAEREARREAEQAELDKAVADAGIRGGPPTLEDMSLPMEYWAKRSALRDAVEAFRSGGLVAVLGLTLSTIASVWSLYLPTS